MQRVRAAAGIALILLQCLVSCSWACDPGGIPEVPHLVPFADLWTQNVVRGVYQGGWGFARSVEVCTYDAECYPWKSANGQYLLFASNNLNGPPREGHQGTTSWDIYISEWNATDQCWGEAVNIGTSINTYSSEHRPSCTPNCDTLYFDRDDDIYMSVRADTGWTQAVALPDPVNTDFEERYPAISADRQRLYFSSDRPPDVPGTGGRDIWVALWGGSSWDSVMNLGFPVNTMNEETRPFESYDGQRLYFSNNHGQPRPGISYGGASDIYVATWADTGWGPVYLVVAPINNDLTACSPYESPDGEEIWFGSEAWEGGRGDEDIWVATTGVSYYPRPTEGYGSWLKAVDIPEAINVYDLEEGWDGTIYAAVACSGVEPTGRVFKTTNKGLSWAPCADLPGAMVVYSLIVDGDTLYAGTYPNGDVFKSVNRGVSWVNTAELPAVTTARSLVRLNNGDILVGTSPYDFSMRNRIFRSTDCGLSWTETASLAQINPCKFIQQTSSGAIFAGGWGIDSQIMIHKSVDNGASWESVVVIDQDECEWTADCFLESETGELFVSGWIPAHGVGFGGGYVCMSTDGGTSWTVCPKIMRGDGVHSGRIYAVTEDPLGTLYAGMQPAPDSVVFASSDKGLTWFSTGGLGGAFECLCLLRTGDGELFAGTTPNGDVFRYAPLIGVAETESPPARQLVQSAPNPFSSSTTIRFTLPEAGRVKVRVFDAQGRCVRTLLDRRMGPGWQYEDFDGTDDNGRRMASGVYIYQVETEKFTASRKFVYLR